MFMGSDLYDTDFDKYVLYKPARLSNHLRIVTAFTDIERISTHMIQLQEGMKRGDYKPQQTVDIILGMTKSSLTQKKHDDICRLLRFLKDAKGMPKISCRYISEGKEVHSKLYVWTAKEEEREVPKIAFCGSLNYTMNAFYKRRELVSKCEPFGAFMYFENLLPYTIDCFDPLAGEKLKNVQNAAAAEEPDPVEEDYSYYDKQEPIDILNVSLLRADGSDTGYGSGINWGIRPNGTKRDTNQAYIPYNRHDKKPGFFPDRINSDDKNCPMFRVITKDFGSFHMRMAQQGNKGLHSVESNAILGEWIRKRLKAPSGGYITKRMLDLYGRSYVTFRKYADGTYLLDF